MVATAQKLPRGHSSTILRRRALISCHLWAAMLSSCHLLAAAWFRPVTNRACDGSQRQIVSRLLRLHVRDFFSSRVEQSLNRFTRLCACFEIWHTIFMGPLLDTLKRIGMLCSQITLATHKNELTLRINLHNLLPPPTHSVKAAPKLHVKAQQGHLFIV